MRRPILGLSTVLAGSGLVAAEIAYAALRRLPLAEGFDPSGRFGNRAAPPLRLALLGDSTITGQGLEDVEDSWARVVAHLFAERFYVDLRCYAAGGARCREVLEEQLPLAESHRFDLAIVSVCSNDILRMTPPWRLRRCLDEVVRRLQEVSSSVVLFGVGDLGSIPRLPWPIDRVAAASGRIADRVHRAVARDRGVPKVDQWGLTTDAFNSGRHMFAADLFHPSPEGHRVWVDALLPTVEAEIARLGLAGGVSLPASGQR